MASPSLTSDRPAAAGVDGAIPLRGFAIVLISASSSGCSARCRGFAYDAGMEPPAFVAWRAIIGFLALGA